MSKRFPEMDDEQLDTAQKEFAARIMKFSTNGLKGPFSVMLYASEIGELILDLGDYLRFSTSIPLPLMELAILTHAANWRDQYEWTIHYKRAVDAGISIDIIEALRTGKTPSFTQADQQAIHDFTVAVSRDNFVDDETFSSLKQVFTDKEVATLTMVLGNYAMLSVMLTVGQVALPENDAPLLDLPPRQKN